MCVCLLVQLAILRAMVTASAITRATWSIVRVNQAAQMDVHAMFMQRIRNCLMAALYRGRVSFEWI